MTINPKNQLNNSSNYLTKYLNKGDLKVTINSK